MIGKDDVVIVKKRKRHPHKAHGGAWKVAYADFVTAMMAFFLVMWIVGQSRSVRAAVAGYFREPGIFDQQKSNGPLPGGEMRLGPNQANEDPSSKEVLKEAQQALEKAASRIKSLAGGVAGVEAAGEADRDHGDARRLAHRAAGRRRADVLRERQRDARAGHRRRAGADLDASWAS